MASANNDAPSTFVHGQTHDHIVDKEAAYRMVPGKPLEMMNELGHLRKYVKAAKTTANLLEQQFGRDKDLSWLMPDLESIDQQIAQMRSRLNAWNYEIRDHALNNMFVEEAPESRDTLVLNALRESSHEPRHQNDAATAVNLANEILDFELSGPVLYRDNNTGATARVNMYAFGEGNAHSGKMQLTWTPYQ